MTIERVDYNGQSIQTAVGRTLRTYVRYGVRVMSDVWEDVLTAEYLTEDGRIGSDSIYGATVTVDATPEVIATAQAANAAIGKEGAADRARQEVLDYLVDMSKVGRGSIVKIVAKRAKNTGASGTVFWVGETRFGVRVGFNVAGQAEPIWTAISNLAVIEHDRESLAELARLEDRAADSAREAFLAELARIEAHKRSL